MVTLKSENGYEYKIASPEKAICDMLYTVSPMKNRAELEVYLFEDLRIDQEEFYQLNMVDLLEITNHFHTQNHKLLKAYIKRRMKNESNK